MKLKITSDGMAGRASHLFLDGVDVSKYVSRVVLTVDAEDAIRADVTFYVTEVECDVSAVIWPLLIEAKEQSVIGDNPVQRRK